MSCRSVVLVGACLQVVLGTRRLRVFTTYSCPFLSVTARTINVAPKPIIFCCPVRNARHSQPWDTTRVARNVKRDTIQDSFAVLRPLLYRGRCRSVATVRRNLNVEILSLSWTIFSAH